MKLLSTISYPSWQASFRVGLVRIALGFARHWLFVLNLLLFIWVGLPWLAPVFMHWGWARAAHAIYFFYSLQCHQLPERSFFMFGPKPMYSLAEIQSAWQNTSDLFVLRQWIGNIDMGWKVAWSDRMISMYTSILLAGLLYAFMRKRLKPLSFRGFALLLFPMVIDGSTHAISDLAGIGQGFRDTNTWLANLTGNIFPSTFYAGDALGSFNSWMRLITGVLFGIAVVWLAFPYINQTFADLASVYESKLRKAGLETK